MALTSYEAHDIVANSRKNPLDAWRRLQEGRGISFAQSFSQGRCSLQELQAGIVERWETYVARYEKLKGKMDDEIKRAGPGIFGAWRSLRST